jgi:hypothetical protein
MNQTIETTQTKVKQRVLLYRDETKKANMLQSFTTLTTQLNTFYQAWTALDLGGITLDQLINIDEPDTYIRHLIFETHPDLTKLPLQKSALLQFIEMPKGMQAFTAAFMPLRNLKYNLHEAPLDLFVIENGRVKSSPKLLSYIDEQCSTYAVSDEEIESYKACEKIFEVLTSLKKKYPHLALVPPVTAQPTVFATGMDGNIVFHKTSTKNVKQ